MLTPRNFNLNQNLYDHNAWDNAFLTKESFNSKRELIETHHSNNNNILYTQDPLHWNIFYSKHKDSFFKDRKWLTQIFPELLSGFVLELGCGVGNSLSHLSNATGCDFSEEAIIIAKKRLPQIYFFVHDLTSNEILPICDFVLMVYCLSAIDKRYYKNIFIKIFNCLKPGGKLFMKDYGYMDMVQTRYKKEQLVNDNFYRRGDGTFTYFFKLAELEVLANEAGFKIERLIEDKKLLINRKRKLEMYRVMVECVFTKPK